MSSCHRRKAGRKRCRVGTVSLAASYDITRHHAIGSGSGSGAGGIRCHSTEGVAEERRGGRSGSGGQTGVRSGSGRRAGVGSGSPYSLCSFFHIFNDCIYTRIPPPRRTTKKRPTQTFFCCSAPNITCPAPEKQRTQHHLAFLVFGGQSRILLACCPIPSPAPWPTSEFTPSNSKHAETGSPQHLGNPVFPCHVTGFLSSFSITDPIATHR